MNFIGRKGRKLWIVLLVVICVIGCDYGKCYAANELYTNTTYVDTDTSELINILELIEDDLYSIGTNVGDELENEQQMLLTDISSCDKGSSDFEKLKAILDIVENDIDLYQEPDLLEMQTSNSAIDEAVIAIGAWFFANDYILAWELLMHSRDNQNPNSTYYPAYGDRVLASPYIAQTKQGLHGTSGSSSFENIGTTVQKDLYYSIHNYDYSYSSSTHKVTVMDIYDYEPNIYDGIANTAVNIMYYAQITHVITPYNVKIIV